MNLLKHKSSLAMLMDAAGWEQNQSSELYRFSEEDWQEAGLDHFPLQYPEKIIAVGHRGAKYFAPENTIAAHETAYQMGARAIEFDVRCTMDSEFVIIHDKKVNRTTNGTGKVKDMTLEQIKALDAGSHIGKRFAGEKIPTLREALRNVRGRFAVDIDFKGGPKNSADMLENILIEEGFEDDQAPLVTIFARRQHFEMLKPLSRLFALRPHFINEERVETIASQNPINIMGLRRLSFSPGAAASIRHNGMHLFTNVMGPYDSDIGFSDAIRAGSLFIQTDNLDRLVPYLENRNLLETRVLGRTFKPLKQHSPSSTFRNVAQITLH